MVEIGASLREARRRRKLELAEVERATRIRIQQLEALEQERFELLPPDPYRRSFLREYADFLGLDGDLYADEYDRRFRPPEPPQPPAARRRSAAQPRLRGGRRLLAAAAVVALVGVAAWQLGRPGGGTRTTPPAPTTHAQTVTPARPHSHPATAPKPNARPGGGVLVLTAAGRCWLWVRIGSSGGRTVYEQTLQPGQTARFGLRRPLWIRIGAPRNLHASIGHQPLTLPTQTGDLLATTAGLQPAP